MGQGHSHSPAVASARTGPTHHEIARGVLLTRAALEREFVAYCHAYGEHALSAPVVRRYLKDLGGLLRFHVNRDLLEALDDAETYTVEGFVALTLQVAHSRVPLSTSLQTQAAFVFSRADDDESERGSKRSLPSAMIAVRPANTLEPVREDHFTPPGQLMAREWSLVFAMLCNRDLNALNITCRFFRTVLFRFPPHSWRVARLTSLEDRTSDDMGSTFAWQRMHSIVRLEIGTPRLGNQCRDTDMATILTHLPELRALKLLYCNMLSFDALTSAPRGHGLRSLTVERTRYVVVTRHAFV